MLLHPAHGRYLEEIYPAKKILAAKMAELDALKLLLFADTTTTWTSEQA